MQNFIITKAVFLKAEKQREEGGARKPPSSCLNHMRSQLGCMPCRGQGMGWTTSIVLHNIWLACQ